MTTWDHNRAIILGDGHASSTHIQCWCYDLAQQHKCACHPAIHSAWSSEPWHNTFQHPPCAGQPVPAQAAVLHTGQPLASSCSPGSKQGPVTVTRESVAPCSACTACAQPGPAQHSTAQHGITHYSTAWHNTGRQQTWPTGKAIS